jgi:DNA-binding transcriptional MerR regulator
MLSIGEFARIGHVSPRMLRHYDQLGLLRPERLDPAPGYRSYGVHQLSRLHRLLALRDLGFTLEQIGDLLEGEPPLEQLRGMLRLRRAELEQTVAEEQGRLRRIEALQRAGAQPGTLVGYYDEPEDDGSVGVHVAFDIGDQSVPTGDGVEIVELPVVEVASVVHRGDMDNIGPVCESVIRWIEDSGFSLAGYSRELYHEMDQDRPVVTELQVPIAR